MLKRIENVEVFYKRDVWGLLTGRYQMLLQVGRKEHLLPGRVPVTHFRELKSRSETQPVLFGTVQERAYWRLGDRWFWDNEHLGADAVAALVNARDLRRQDTVNRARSVAAMTTRPVPAHRTAVPNDVKQVVWHRDGGACRGCGSNTELQYDHVIPLAMGGGSTEDNLQILCGPCNRRKGASVA